MKKQAFASSLSILASFVGAALPALAQNQTVNGNLAVTGTADVDGNAFTFGTQSGSYGVGFLYSDTDTDTLSFHLNRETAAWLWAHNSTIGTVNALRLNSAHELIFYKSDGITVGAALSPVTGTLSLGGVNLYRNTSGGLQTDGAFNVGGVFSASSYTATGGELTGGADGLNLNAGGTDQNIVLSPSGNGSVVLEGKLGIGTDTPSSELSIEMGTLAAPAEALSIHALDAGGVTDLMASIGFGSDPGGVAAIGSMEFKIADAFDLMPPVYVFRGTDGNSFSDSVVFSSGNVGIGTADTAAKLTIFLPENGDTAAVQFRTVSEDLVIGASYAVEYNIGFGDGAVDNNNGVPLSNAALIFSASLNDPNGYFAVGAYLFQGGSVGIGTTGTPAALLEVAGDTVVQGALTVAETSTPSRFKGPVLIAPQGDLPMGTAYQAGEQP